MAITEIRPQKGFQEQFVRTNVDLCIAGGVLNPLPLDAQVSTPNGFVRIGDIKIGDIVNNPMGGLQKVNAIVDKKACQCVLITLDDGRMVECSLDHRWLVVDVHGNEYDYDAETLIFLYQNDNLYIPTTKPIEVNLNNAVFSNCISPFFDLKTKIDILVHFLEKMPENDVYEYKTDDCVFAYSLRDVIFSCGGLCYIERKENYYKLTAKIDLIKFTPQKNKIVNMSLINKKDCRCINVSGEEHLFLTDNFIITRNCGKAQPYDALVATAKGFVRMGDLKVGDKITDTSGYRQTIKKIHEQGELPVVRITFDTGDVVECSADHLWEVEFISEKNITAGFGESYTWSCKQMRQRGFHKLCIKLPEPIQFEDSKPLQWHAYILGLSVNSYTIEEETYKIQIHTSIDNAMAALSLAQLQSHEYLFNSREQWFVLEGIEYIQYFKQHNFHDQNNAIIPEEIKVATYEDRMWFIKGVFDNHAYINSEGVIVCKLPNNDLSQQIIDLLKTLSTKVIKIDEGDTLTLNVYTERPNRFFANTNKHIDREYFRVFFTIKDMEFTDVLKPMRCLKVSSPNSLYLTNGYIPTHNTFAAVLSVAEPSRDPNFNALFLRNNLGDLRAGGGIIDTFRQIYGKNCEITESGEPRVVFKSGAKVDVTHVADQSKEKVLQRFKGRQYDFIYFDEGTGFTWDCFTAIYTRNRGTAKWTGKVRMTTNPEREHWLRKFLDWYIGEDGRIREDRNGVVRYFYVNGEKVEDVVWGDSKQEVYELCKISIDRKLKAMNGDEEYATYDDLIKSFTFYLGRMSENKASINNNKGYAGSVAIMGGSSAQQNLEGNWNASVNDSRNELINTDDMLAIFTNDPQTNGQRYITADLADSGTDNFVALAWDGFHLFDILVLCKTTPRMNAEALLAFASKHNIPDRRIIYDAIRGIYINDYIQEAVPFMSSKAPQGMYKRQFANLKAECYYRLIECIKRRNFSIDDNVLSKVYEHQNNKRNYTVRNEFIEELQVVKFEDSMSGKLSLMSKKKMNAELGNGRSMDLLDPCAMLMSAYGDYIYGDELIRTLTLPKEYEQFVRKEDETDIYSDELWC